MNGRPAPSSETVWALRRLMAFSPLDDDDLRLLSQAMSSAHAVPARREILAQGEPIRQPLILLEGWAYRSHMLSDGRRQILHVLVPGDLIGLSSHRNPTAPTNVAALTNVLLCPAPPPAVGQVGKGLAEAYALSRASEDECLLRQIVRLGRLTAHERTMDWILEIGERVAAAGLGTADTFRLPITQEAIADILGLTSVHLNRTLQSMRRENYLQMQGGVVKILDRERCARLADYPQVASAASVGIFR